MGIPIGRPPHGTSHGKAHRNSLWTSHWNSHGTSHRTSHGNSQGRPMAIPIGRPMGPWEFPWDVEIPMGIPMGRPMGCPTGIPQGSLMGTPPPPPSPPRPGLQHTGLVFPRPDLLVCTRCTFRGYFAPTARPAPFSSRAVFENSGVTKTLRFLLLPRKIYMGRTLTRPTLVGSQPPTDLTQSHSHAMLVVSSFESPRTTRRWRVT